MPEKTSNFKNHFTKSIFCSAILMYLIALLIIPVNGQAKTDFTKRFDNIFAKSNNNISSSSGQNLQTGLVIKEFLRTGTKWNFGDWAGN
ncbi:MAG: hypothetical protein ABI891_07545, partial [Acidobacteriota bacterium]